MALAVPPARAQPAISPGVSLHLDALRGGSAIVVLLSHFSEIVLNPHLGAGPVSRASGLLASYAVMAFFALSGFMIAASIWRNVQRHAGDFDARRFASDRFFRLYPPLIAALLVCAVTAALHRVVAGSASANLLLPGNIQAARDKITFDPIEALLALVQAQGLDPRIDMQMNGPLWSLGYEFWFYVLAGLAALTIVRRRVLPVAGILVLLVAPLALDNARFYGFLIIWCLGAVWFAALTSRIDGARLTRAAQIAAAGFVVAAVAALVVGGPRTANPHYTGAEFVFQTAIVGLGLDRARGLPEAVYHSGTARRACDGVHGGVLIHALRRALPGAAAALRIRESIPRRALDRVQHRLLNHRDPVDPALLARAGARCRGPQALAAVQSAHAQPAADRGRGAALADGPEAQPELQVAVVAVVLAPLRPALPALAGVELRVAGPEDGGGREAVARSVAQRIDLVGTHRARSQDERDALARTQGGSVTECRHDPAGVIERNAVRRGRGRRDGLRPRASRGGAGVGPPRYSSAAAGSRPCVTRAARGRSKVNRSRTRASPPIGLAFSVQTSMNP